MSFKNLSDIRVLTSNVEAIKARKLDAKNAAIDIAVLQEDIEKANPNPVFYAYRWGMCYDPKKDFKPDVPGNNAIKGQLVIEYADQLSAAKLQYQTLVKKEQERRAEEGQGGADPAEIKELQNVITRKEQRIDELNIRLKALQEKQEEKNNGGAADQIAIMQKMITDLKELTPQRIVIEINGEKREMEKKIFHEKFEKILYLIASKKHVYLYGPAGTGKSELAKQLAEAAGLDFYPASTVTQEHKLTGYRDMNGLYQDTNFYKAVKYGGLFFLDEMDSCAPEVLVAINGLLANKYFDFPHETVKAHENFVCIGAGNTIGRGADAEYTGRAPLDRSTLDRFLVMMLDYSPAIDAAIAQGDTELVEFAQAVRAAAKTTGISILMSYRSIKEIAELKDNKLYPLPEVVDMAVIKGLAADDVLLFARNMNIDSTNKYFKAFKKAAELSA